MMKKLIATALAAAMIFGLVSVALAAGFSDIEDHARKNDILKLVSLGIIDGYPDGTFKPENPVTRAEFAKLIVTSMGLGEAAKLMAGVPTPFSDVAASHWATGYINLAHSKNIVNGYPDGTYKPEAQVTHAEALKMILCALGYTESVLKPVYWPVTWVAKAVELRLNAGVSVSANVPAVRGDIAALLENSLTIAHLVQEAYGDQVIYKKDPNVTFLAALAGQKPVEGILIGSPELFVTDEKIYLADVTDGFTLLDETDAYGLLGHEVRVWPNADNEVLFIEDLTPADSVKVGSLVTVDSVVQAKKFKVGTTTYVVEENKYHLFKDYAVEDDESMTFESGDEITVIFKGKSPKAVVVNNYQTGVVSSVSTTYERLYFSETSGASSLRLADKNVRFVGDASKLSEIKKGDVVQFIDGSDDAVLIVTREAVEGELTKITSTNVATIDGVQYKFAAPATTTGVAEAYGSLLGDDVTALLNKDGRIVHIAAVDEVEDVEIIAAVLRVGGDVFGDPILKLRNADGTTVTLNVDPDADACDLGDIIAYTLDDDVIDTIKVEFTADQLKSPEEKITVEGKYHLVKGAVMTADTAFFDYRNAFTEGGDFTGTVKVIKRADIEANSEIDGRVLSSGGKANIVVMADGVLASGSEGLGMVVGTYRNAAGKYVLSVLADGTVSDYVYGTSKPGIASKKVIEFTVSGTNNISVSDVLGAETLPSGADEFRVISIDVENSILKVQAYTKEGDSKGDPLYLVVTEDTLFYDVSDSPESVSIEELAVNAIVDIYLDGSFVLVLVVK